MNEWMNVSILIVPIPFTTYMYAPVKMKRTFFDKPHRERHLRFIIKMAKITHFVF